MKTATLPRPTWLEANIPPPPCPCQMESVFREGVSVLGHWPRSHLRSLEAFSSPAAVANPAGYWVLRSSDGLASRLFVTVHYKCETDLAISTHFYEIDQCKG